MKKLLSFVIAALLVGAVNVHAAVNSVPKPASEGVIYEHPVGAKIGTPRTVVIPVRYSCRSANAATAQSGDVVVWDLTSADGVTISLCSVNNAISYAGVLVTDILTAENSETDHSQRNWGYMAIKGYCLAKVTTANATTGKALCTNGSQGSGTTYVGAFGTLGEITPNTDGVSVDIGVLLTDTGTNGLMPVMLR